MIEILVAVGDTVAVEDPLITLESDKATMDVPSPAAGVVKAIHVKVGDNVSEGSAVLDLETTSGDQAPSRPIEDAPAPTPEVVEERASESPIASAAQVATEAGETPAVAAAPADS